MRKLLVLSVLGLLAACNQAAPSKSDAGKPAAAAGPAMPPPPAWSAGLAGQDFAAAFPATFACTGYVDGPTDKGAGWRAVVGWSWVADKGAGVEHVVVADAAGKIAGFGDGGIARPDVPTAVKAVTRPDVGWNAKVAATTGAYTVYGVDLATKSACKLGEARL